MAFPPPPGPPQPPPPRPPQPQPAPQGSFQPPPPGQSQGYYPQQAYYAPGWVASAAQPSPRRRRRATLAVLITLAAVVVLGGSAWGIGYWLQTRTLGEIGAPTTAMARQVTIGHCLAELPPDGSVSRVRLVPCADPHEAEVVGMLALGPGPWPGQESVDERVEPWCEMDTAQLDAGFTAVFWTPSARGWAQGDTQGVCLAWSEDGGVTGSWADGNVTTR